MSLKNREGMTWKGKMTNHDIYRSEPSSIFLAQFFVFKIAKILRNLKMIETLYTLEKNSRVKSQLRALNCRFKKRENSYENIHNSVLS